jgi:hypothetical protein
MNVTRRNLTKVFVRQPKDRQQFEKQSDLIFIFTNPKECALLTERVPRERYSNIQWACLRLKYMLKKRHVEREDSTVREITIAREYIDITVCKGWWFKFLKEGSLEDCPSASP